MLVLLFHWNLELQTAWREGGRTLSEHFRTSFLEIGKRLGVEDVQVLNMEEGRMLLETVFYHISVSELCCVYRCHLGYSSSNHTLNRRERPDFKFQILVAIENTSWFSQEMLRGKKNFNFWSEFPVENIEVLDFH